MKRPLLGQKIKMKEKLVFVNIIISILLMSMLFNSCQNDMNTITEYMHEESMPTEQLKEVEYIYSENGLIKSKMSCGMLKRYNIPENYTEFSEGFVLSMYDSLGVKTSIISANYAKRLENTQLFEALHSVEVVDIVEEKVLNTEQLFWDEKNHRIYTDKFVKITTPDKVIYGDGLEANDQFTDYYIKHPKGDILVTRKESQDEE